MLFTVAAFNAHWGFGRFGSHRGVRFDVARIIESFGADIVVVPEAWRDDDGRGVLDPLRDVGFHVETVEMMRLEYRRRTRSTDGRGAASRPVGARGLFEVPVVLERTYPIGVIPDDPPGPRNALSVTVGIDGTPVEVVGLHTSSKVWKLAPVRHLLNCRNSSRTEGPQILAGDFNFWGPPIAALMPGWQRPVRGRTYPSPRPHSQIDHVLVRGGIEALDGEVLAETPSDHRPIRTRLRLVGGVT